MIHMLNKVLSGQSLSRQEAFSVMSDLADQKVTPEQAAAFLIALRMKSETVDEITGFVESLKSRARLVDVSRKDLIDVCGTGGDSLGTFNVSTTVTFVIAACGLGIAKHGNRSVSSRSGSFDVLESLGVPFSDDPLEIKKSIEKFGLGFCFAPAFHPALKNLSGIRKALGVRTVFNLLGPLLNPVSVKRQVIGVYSPLVLEKVAEVLRELGSEEVMVVHGRDGLDEFSISSVTDVVHLKEKKIHRFSVAPEDFGLAQASLSELQGGSPEENAKILIDILQNKKGPKTDLVLMNAAAALVVGGKAKDFKGGVEIARQAIATGRAFQLLEQMQKGVS